MGVLDKITKMRNEGKSDEEIQSDLKKEGASSREIREGLNQAQIKKAVSDIQGDDELQAPSPSGTEPEEDTYTPRPQANRPTTPRTMDVSQQGYGANQGYQDYNYAPQPQQQETYYPQDYGQEGYDNYNQYSPMQPTNTDTIVEISEQVFSEKIETVRKKVEDVEEFKNLAQTRLENLMERIRRIESVMDKLQAAILEKIGSYGQNLESIKKEMGMMQDSFSKTLNPLIDIAKGKGAEAKSSSKKTTRKTTSRKTSKK
jgi:hypothetical protein